MSANEIVNKARLLDEDGNYEGVVALLQEYVKENPNDRDAMALYQSNQSNKLLGEGNADLEQLIKTDETRFSNVTDEEALRFSDWCFAGRVARVYLKNDTKEKQEAAVFAWLELELCTLGNRLDEYEVAKEQLNKYRTSLYNCGYAGYFFAHLLLIIDWQTETTVNILKYISEELRSIAIIKSEQKIYDQYVEGMTENVFPFDEMPPLNGDSVVIKNVKTQEQLDFWKGYFAQVKKVREEEYAAIKELTTNENCVFYGAFVTDARIMKSWHRQVSSGAITTADVARIQVDSRCYRGELSEGNYKNRLERAEKSYNTIRMNPGEEIKADPVAYIKELIDGFLKKFLK